jgi:uncharacterized protein (TIGR03086 family)
MSLDEIRDRHDRLSKAFAAKIDQIPSDKWESPSPCEGWSARDVVKHVSETPAMIFKMAGREFGDTPPVEKDPAAAFASTRQKIQDVLKDSDVATTEYDSVFGRTSLAQSIDRFINFDLVVHGWDLSRAAGLDERIDPQDIARVHAAAESLGDAARNPQVLGPEVPVPDDADEQTKLIGFLGRQP